MNNERIITRKQLVKALESIGVFAEDGGGKNALHRSDGAAIMAINMWGDRFPLNGETNDDYECLVIKIKENNAK